MINARIINMTKDQLKATPYPFDEIYLVENSGKIYTIGKNADGTGTAVHAQDGHIPAVNCFGNETGLTLLEEFRAGNLEVVQDGYNRGSVYALI